MVVTLAEELHFGRTASLLHVSQPALSGTLKTLEQDLGISLFRRTSRNVQLTAAGEIFVAEARRLLDETELALARVKAAAGRPAQPCRVGYSASIDLNWLGRLISQVRSAGLQPRDLEFVSADESDLQPLLAKGSLDAAFVLPAPAPGNDWKSGLSVSQELVAASHSKHVFWQAQQVSFRQLATQPIIWLRRDLNPQLYDRFSAICAAEGYQPNIVQEVKTFQECVEFARCGVGVALVPKSTINADGGSFSLTISLLPPKSLTIEHSLVYRSTFHLSTVERLVKIAGDQSTNEMEVNYKTIGHR